MNEFEALLQMVEDDGATPAGSMPSPEYVRALRENSDLHGPQAVVDAHRNADPPKGGTQK
jgi:hypothetical protein